MYIDVGCQGRNFDWSVHIKSTSNPLYLNPPPDLMSKVPYLTLLSYIIFYGVKASISSISYPLSLNNAYSSLAHFEAGLQFCHNLSVIVSLTILHLLPIDRAISFII